MNRSDRYGSFCHRLILAAPLALVSCSLFRPGADLVLRGGRLYTLNPEKPWAEALAIDGETLLAVGSGRDMDRFIGHQTRLIDLDGRLVLPGFNDSHVHFLEGSLGLDQVKLDDALSLEEMKDVVRVYTDKHPELPWIVGMGWNYSYIEGGRLPSRRDLDEVVSDRPVFLEAYDGHTAWVNSRALEMAGIDRSSRPQGYGEIVRDPATGEPTGALKEEGAMDLVRRVIPQPSREERLEALRRGIAYAHRFGVTAIQTAGGRLDSGAYAGDSLDLYAELASRGDLLLRVSFALSVDKDTADADLDLYDQRRRGLDGPWLKAGAVKIMMDGVIEPRTAALIETYADEPSSGATEYTQEEIDAWVGKLDGRGYQILTHAIGDRAVRMVLDAYEKASPGGPRRHRIEHIEVVSRADIPRFGAMGVLASMQPHHGSPSIVHLWSRRVGPPRWPQAFAWKSLARAGARLAFGSDWPVVGLDPMLGIYTAVTRQGLDGKPENGWVPEERLSIEEAVHGYTLGGAYASFVEDERGSLEPGKLADLVVLTEDVFRIARPRIAEVEPAMTVVGGRVVHVSPSFLPEERRRDLLARDRKP